MNERLLYLRKSILKLSQEAFGTRIGIKSRSHICAMESGEHKINDRVIKDICREFNVNENWLRTGEGEPMEDNLNYGTIVAQIGINDPIMKDILIQYGALSHEDKALFTQFVAKFLDLKKPKE